MSQVAGDVLDELRLATAEAHARLERATGLSSPIIEKGRVVEVLRAFWGFHVVWEPAVTPILGTEILARRRLPILRADLRSLGYSDTAIDALPSCRPAARLGAGLEAALGSLYVMEGSTLGGQVISRILDRSPDLIGRVRYFDPYGPRTGAMWRAFRAGLRGRVAAGADRQSIVAAAVQTFELLEDWLIRPEQGLRDGRSVR